MGDKITDSIVQAAQDAAQRIRGVAPWCHANALELLQQIRASGWRVAVHNDYVQDGKSFTFWGFSKDNVWVRGEGRTDAEALAAVCRHVGISLQVGPCAPVLVALGELGWSIERIRDLDELRARVPEDELDALEADIATVLRGFTDDPLGGTGSLHAKIEILEQKWKAERDARAQVEQWLEEESKKVTDLRARLIRARTDDVAELNAEIGRLRALLQEANAETELREQRRRDQQVMIDTQLETQERAGDLR